MKLITFQVPDEVAEEMTRRSVYLDVFGFVRWTATTEVVADGTRWDATSVTETAEHAAADRSRTLNALLDAIGDIDEPGSDSAALTREAKALARRLATAPMLIVGESAHV